MINWLIDKYLQLLLLLIVISCDRLSLKQSELLATCQKVERSLQYASIERKAMLRMIKLMYSRSVSFNVGGAFQVDRKIIFGVLSVVITYLILLVQFKS